MPNTEPSTLSIETEFPSLCQALELIANHQHPTIKRLHITLDGIVITMLDGSHKVVNRIQPNDLCYCGSSKKYKKCRPTHSADRMLTCPHCHKPVFAEDDLSAHPELNTQRCYCYDPKQKTQTEEILADPQNSAGLLQAQAY